MTDKMKNIKGTEPNTLPPATDPKPDNFKAGTTKTSKDSGCGCA